MTAAELYDESWSHPRQERREILQRAAALADTEGDVDLAFRIRRSIISESQGDPNGLPLITAYGWCLARHDEDPSRFPFSLWEYKWVANHAPKYHTIDRAQIEALLDDMDRRYTAQGEPPAPVLKERVRAAQALGDRERAAELFGRWTAAVATAGRLNDCRACDTATRVGFLAYLGRDDEAVAAGREMLERRLRCASQPHMTLGTILGPARRLGAQDDAAQWHRQGLQMIAGDADYVSTFGEHLRHAALVGDLKGAVSIIERTVAMVRGDDLSKLAYARGVRLALALADHRGESVEALERIEPGIGGLAVELSAGFDRRNGNDAYSQTLAADDAEFAAWR